MKSPMSHRTRKERGAGGMTLIEVLLAMGIGSLVLAAVLFISLFGFRSFGAMANYTELDNRSRNTLDLMSRDIREAAQVADLKNTGTTRWLLLTNAAGNSIKYTWDASSQMLVCEKTGEPVAVYLTGCERWDFQVFQRTPRTNNTYTFFPATNAFGVFDPSICKVINMSWKCSRRLLNRYNTESVQTAQVVLRNKQ
jgi:type II secretory pathway pseudopilin PulG